MQKITATSPATILREFVFPNKLDKNELLLPSDIFMAELRSLTGIDIRPASFRDKAFISPERNKFSGTPVFTKYSRKIDFPAI